MLTWTSDQVRTLAAEVGFDICRITSVEADWPAGVRLRDFVAAGYHGDMGWMEETLERRVHPRAMWPEARSAVVFGLNYGPDHDPLEALKHTDHAVISVYAKGRDYHDIIKKRLKQFAREFANGTGADVKVFVDTAPLMEKPLAAQSGLGWQGKHTNLVSRSYGSWLFLGVMLTTAGLTPDPPETDHCGSCRACLDICPTKAFPAPYQLDARKCISYLTIEHDGPVPHEFRKLLGNRIYGCDDCLAVCPWNKFAQETRDMKLAANPMTDLPSLEVLAELDEDSFRERFSGSPVKRIKRRRFLRNVLIAIGNSGNPHFVLSVIRLLGDEEPLVRGAAVWALAQLDYDAFEDQKALRRDAEQDADVRAEWETGPDDDRLPG
jgi:epoxyqueuosine reductase